MWSDDGDNSGSIPAAAPDEARGQDEKCKQDYTNASIIVSDEKMCSGGRERWVRGKGGRGGDYLIIHPRRKKYDKMTI